MQITLQLSIEKSDLESLSEMMSGIRKAPNVKDAVILELQTPAQKLEQDLERVLNHHSAENESNTPDYVLASLLKNTLATWNLHTKERDRWYGNRSLLGPGNDMPAIPTDGVSLLK